MADAVILHLRPLAGAPLLPPRHTKVRVAGAAVHAPFSTVVARVEALLVEAHGPGVLLPPAAAPPHWHASPPVAMAAGIDAALLRGGHAASPRATEERRLRLYLRASWEPLDDQRLSDLGACFGLPVPTATIPTAAAGTGEGGAGGPSAGGVEVELVVSYSLGHAFG